MERDNKLKILYDTGRTVFTLKNLADLWNLSSESAKVVVKRMVDKNVLYRVASGYYTITEKYNLLELANLITTPSYVSLQSALFYHNISFQVSNIITSVAKINYTKKIGDTIFKYHSMKEEIFFNLEGLNYHKTFTIATPERAILDCLYFGYLPDIDNPEKINFTYLKELSLFYPKSVRKKVKEIIEK